MAPISFSSSSPLAFRPRRAFPLPYPTAYEGILAERRQKRVSRSRPWLPNSVSKRSASKTLQSEPKRRAVGPTASSNGKEKGVPTATPSRLVEVWARAVRSFAGYNRDAAYASGCRLPRLVTKTAAPAVAKASVIVEEIAAVAGGEKEPKLSPSQPLVAQAESNEPVSDTSSDTMD